jgi:hypothetical protein
MLKWFLIALIAFLVWAYVRFNYKMPNGVVILQTSLADFTLKMLLEKQPIVIQDRVENIQPIWDGWFRYNIKGRFEIRPEMEWVRNRHKYMLLHGLEDGEVMLCHPRCKTNNRVPDETEEIIAVKLYKGMSMIVPYRWHVAVNKPVYAGGVHDLFTYLLPA